MPAHCSREQVGKKRLGDGSVMTELDLKGNADVDALAKSMAARHKVPASQRQLVKRQSGRLVAVARWLGTVTELANAFPVPDLTKENKHRHLRDSTGLKPKPKPKLKAQPKTSAARGVKRKCGDADARTTGDLSGCARWEQLRQRIRERVRSGPT